MLLTYIKNVLLIYALYIKILLLKYDTNVTYKKSVLLIYVSYTIDIRHVCY